MTNKKTREILKHLVSRFAHYSNILDSNAFDWLRYTPEAKVYHQRLDDLKSLRNMAYRYAFWKPVVSARNNRPPLNSCRLILVRAIRGLMSDVVHDRSLKLFTLSLMMFPTEIIGHIKGKNAALKI